MNPPSIWQASNLHGGFTFPTSFDPESFSVYEQGIFSLLNNSKLFRRQKAKVTTCPFSPI